MIYDYRTMSLEEIFSKIDRVYSKYMQDKYALNLVNEIADSREIGEDFDPMCYLAEYFSSAEWREWLIDTFLAEEGDVLVDTIDGTYQCLKSFDTKSGNLIDVYKIDKDNVSEYVGFFYGNLDDLTEDELISKIEDGSFDSDSLED